MSDKHSIIDTYGLSDKSVNTDIDIIQKKKQNIE